MHIAAGIFSFLVALIALRHVHPNGILFYQGIATAVVCSIVQWTISRRLQTQGRWRGAPSALGKDAALTFFACYAFMFTIPTTVDRAYTVRMILEIADSPAGLSEQDLQAWMLAHWNSQRGLGRRIEEQLTTGTIEAHNGRYALTQRGRILAAAFSATSEIFACQLSSR
jgi:hypothetical protein